jgi:hypothetical protein
MLRSSLLVIALAATALHPTHVRAQPASTAGDDARSDDVPRPRLSFRAAYFGETIFHPGLMAGVEYRLLDGDWGALFVTGNLGSYVHVRNHVGAFLDSELGYRFTYASGYQLEALAGLGYLHTFLAAPVYEVDAAGHVNRVFDAGRPAFMPTFALGTGWRFDKFAPFLRLQAFGQYPFNHQLLPHAALLLGARFWLE